MGLGARGSGQGLAEWKQGHEVQPDGPSGLRNAAGRGEGLSPGLGRWPAPSRGLGVGGTVAMETRCANGRPFSVSHHTRTSILRSTPAPSGLHPPSDQLGDNLRWLPPLNLHSQAPRSPLPPVAAEGIKLALRHLAQQALAV